MPAVARAEVAVVDRLLCDACGLCVALCPPLALTMRRDGLVVSAAACTGCRKCIAPCPVGALRMVDADGPAPPAAVAPTVLDDSVAGS